MVVLQHSHVVVQNGQLAPGIAEEGVGPSRVVHIVDSGCDERSDLIKWV